MFVKGYDSVNSRRIKKEEEKWIGEEFQRQILGSFERRDFNPY